MRYRPEEGADDWVLLELFTEPNKRPCSDAYSRAKINDLVQIFRELRLLKAAGVPPDHMKGNPDVQSWKKKCKYDHHETEFFVLKAKPSGWRLYFMVASYDRREIVFLWAVNKKKDDRNQKDFQRLCRARARIVAREEGVYVDDIHIPDR